MKVLIAEDDNACRLFMVEMIKKWGYEPVAVPNGAEAWELLKGDLTLRMAVLDWIMPGMDGIDICRRIKRENNRPYLYTVLATSKSDRKDRLQGLDSGADDFLSKPVDTDELRSRLAAGARILEYEEKLRDYGTQMERLAAERAQQLVHADRLATLGVLAAGIAHEINNPVAVISGNIQTMECFWNPWLREMLRTNIETHPNERRLRLIDETMPEMMSQSRQALERIMKIVNGLKGYAKKKDDKKSLFDINESLSRTCDFCRYLIRNRVQPSFEFADNLPPVIGDSQKLEQVFVNLFTNAADAMDALGGGKLRIATALCPDGKVRINVDDSGPGIPPDKLSRIWEPFFTTKGAEKGTGLGLSISKEIVEEHGGSITAENLPGSGARFTIILPCGKIGQQG